MSITTVTTSTTTTTVTTETFERADPDVCLCEEGYSTKTPEYSYEVINLDTQSFCFVVDEDRRASWVVDRRELHFKLSLKYRPRLGILRGVRTGLSPSFFFAFTGQSSLKALGTFLQDPKSVSLALSPQ